MKGAEKKHRPRTGNGRGGAFLKQDATAGGVSSLGRAACSMLDGAAEETVCLDFFCRARYNKSDTDAGERAS